MIRSDEDNVVEHQLARFARAQRRGQLCVAEVFKLGVDRPVQQALSGFPAFPGHRPYVPADRPPLRQAQSPGRRRPRTTLVITRHLLKQPTAASAISTPATTPAESTLRQTRNPHPPTRSPRLHSHPHPRRLTSCHQHPATLPAGCCRIPCGADFWLSPHPSSAGPEAG